MSITKTISFPIKPISLRIYFAYCLLSWLILFTPQKNAYSQQSSVSLISPLADPLSTYPPEIDSNQLASALSLCPTLDISPVLTLELAVNLALCHNQQIKSAHTAIKVQAAALGEARAAYLPTLSISASRMKDQVDYPSMSNNFEVISNTLYSSFSWRLFDFGGRNANRRSAQALLNAALANHQATIQKVLVNVISNYFDTQTAIATWQEKIKAEIFAQQILSSAQRRETRGIGSQLDSMQASTALAKASLEKNRAQANYQKAFALLRQSLGVSPNAALKLQEDVVDNDLALRQDLDDWLIEIQNHHPALITVRQQLISAQEKILVAKSDGLFTLDFNSSFYQNGRPNQSLTPNTNETLTGLTLTFPLFDGFTRTYKIRGAQALAEQKAAEALDTEYQILTEVVKSHAEAKAALENLQASKHYLDSAQATLQSMQRKFDKGAVDILSILNAQTSLAEAQQERIRCLSEWRSAKLRLLANAGILWHNTHF